MKAIITLLILLSLAFAESDVPSKLFNCPSVREEFCGLVNEPTCAWLDPRINCVAKKYPCAKNVKNSCEACKVRDAVSYSNGPCPEDHVMYEPKKKEERVFCTEDKRNQMCTMEFNPTCAYLNSEIVNCGKACGLNAGNPCLACTVENVESYVLGHCPGEKIFRGQNISSRKICSEEQKKARICTKEYNPMCSWLNNKLVNCENKCGVDAGNPCMACGVENVESYTPGRCPTDKLYIKPNIQKTLCTEEQKKAEVCPMVFEPTCSWLDSSKVNCGSTCAVFSSNPCKACTIPNVESFSQGKCPPETIFKGDNSVRTTCTEEQKKAEICTEEFRPTCAWLDSKKVNCGKACAVASTNICNACTVPNVEGFTNGDCPPESIFKGDNTVRTTCTEEQKNNKICTMEFNPTCAWLDAKKVNCGEECAINAGNPCQACTILFVKGFTAGQCPENKLYKGDIY